MASLILPNQLFDKTPGEGKLYIYEHPKYFTEFDFHRKKLVLHRASMKAYSDEEKDAEYIEFDEDIEKVFQEEDKLVLYDPVDHSIREKLQELAKSHDARIEFRESPGFLASMDFNREYFSENDYYQLSYYKEMRKRFDVLIDEEGKPEGGKWSFDPENRKKMPEGMEKPEIPQFSSKYVEEAKKYVNENFPENPGEIEDFFWSVTREQALKNLDDFLQNRLGKFGDYQDAIDSDLKFGFHSLLSSCLNIGLITPEQVIDRTLEAYEEKDYPMNSLEGFIRQIMGWREFVRSMYELEPEMTEKNFWNADNLMPEAFYTADTGLPPVDDSISHAVEDAYCHHIERLMVLGNIMLLLEIDPDEVYSWFMEMFIDSYEWVMIPNVYGMSQYSWDGMMTKPYISSSNYIRKMSNYGKGDWEDYWDGIYWSFIDKHSEKVSDIQRMSFMVSTLERMDDKSLENKLDRAQDFRDKIGLRN